MRTQGQVADGVLVRWLRQGHSVTLSLGSIVLNVAKSLLINTAKRVNYENM